MSKNLLVANWKMNFKLPEATEYVARLEERYEQDEQLEVVLAPTTLFIPTLKSALSGDKIQLASQTLSAPEFGAFTGETSCAQLAGLVEYSIIGHSERRQYFNETDDDIAEKVKFALGAQITPIICVGETAQQRADGQTVEVLTKQLVSALDSIDASQVIVAYEPIWAISSTPGVQQATPGIIAATISEIKQIIANISSAQPPILYGGSVNPDNLESYLKIPEISGALIGNASLDVEKMCAMIEIAKRVEQ